MKTQIRDVKDELLKKVAEEQLGRELDSIKRGDILKILVIDEGDDIEEALGEHAQEVMRVTNCVR